MRRVCGQTRRESMRFHFAPREIADIILPAMNQLMLHEFHQSLGARFAELNGAQIVNDYGDWLAEHAALRETAGVIDLSFRSRICLVGADRARFLHGQVTNDVKKLRVGEGCYAAITTAKGKMESDLNIFALADALLLDFEPGLMEKISQRLEKFPTPRWAKSIWGTSPASMFVEVEVTRLKLKKNQRLLTSSPTILASIY